jgi:FkbM family methyltransferase
MKSFINSILGKFGFRVSQTGPTYYDLIKSIRLQLICQSPGVLHLGAHHGQEAEFYNKLGRQVIWIEALPIVYEKLLANIERFSLQKGILALLGDTNKDDQRMNLASNSYESSSIFEFGQEMNHKNLAMVDTVKLAMVRLDELFNPQQLTDYRHWVIDVQGAELLVLHGAGELLRNASSIEIEVSTKLEYLGGARWEDLRDYLATFSFFPLWLPKDKSHEDLFFVKKPQ